MSVYFNASSVASPASRSCVRCGKELTDAASMEVGIGPICRKLDNAILATHIPANVAAALDSFAGIPELPIGAVQDTFNNVLAALKAGGKSDWRVEVKRMEWMLSFEAVRQVAYKGMLATVRALGYVGLASLWEGEAATGLATVRFESGRLFIKGPRNKGAVRAFRAIVGRLFHGATKEWSVPAAQSAAFTAAVHAHYPVNTGLDAALAAATAVTAATPAPSPSAPSQKPASGLLIEAAGATLVIKTPYSAAFVGQVKSLPYPDRKWDAAQKAWVVNAAHLDTVKGMVAACYGKQPVVTGEAVVAAPAKPVVDAASVVVQMPKPVALPLDLPF